MFLSSATKTILSNTFQIGTVKNLPTHLKSTVLFSVLADGIIGLYFSNTIKIKALQPEQQSNANLFEMWFQQHNDNWLYVGALRTG